ncbi:unnamed protein product [Acanthoscelides obtectus]|uniref:Uncharacterized protein n=1 Tax=Acanthoscelides obtectus TaxID=200917 RepID=A0A9P0L9C5_ACAOB|nr:unnamed protein product [Acanthoscelides obtectus]CAK1630569.1 hypothetical protein AOBTE_LOCUS6415 [Acanthoscelides obtectus]
MKRRGRGASRGVRCCGRASGIGSRRGIHDGLRAGSRLKEGKTAFNYCQKISRSSSFNIRRKTNNSISKRAGCVRHG